MTEIKFARLSFRASAPELYGQRLCFVITTYLSRTVVNEVAAGRIESAAMFANNRVLP
jgi:hypothetical protein